MSLAEPTKDSWKWLLTSTGARRSITRIATNKALMIVPPGRDRTGVFNVDAKFRRWLTATADALTDQLKPTINEDGSAGANGVVTDFYSLRTLAGFYMNPSTVPMLDNTAVRESLNLIDGFATTRHEKIWDALAKEMFGKWEPSPLSIRKAASTGFPRNTTNMAVKSALLGDFLRNATEIMERTIKGDLRSLSLEAELFYAYGIGRRDQPDTVLRTKTGWEAKPREVNDEEFARSMGREGRRFIADKSVKIDGQIMPGLFAMRRRTVWAAPFPMNYFLAALMSQFRGHYLNAFAFTFKHRGADDLTEKTSRYAYAVGVDVKQYDQSIAGRQLDFMIDRWAVTDNVKAFAKMTRKMPFAMSHPALGGVGYFDPFFGDPWDPRTFTTEPGLPSGIAWNPDAGKFCATAALLCLIDDHQHDVLEVGLDTILKGRHLTYAILDASDDGIILTNSEKLHDYVKERFADTEAPAYYRFAIEEGLKFLGNVQTLEHSGRKRFVPDILTYFRNLYVPEHGLPTDDRKNPHREFAAMGYFARKEIYKNAPSFGHAIEIADDLWRTIFNESLDSRWDAAYRDMRLPQNMVHTAYDLEAILDPLSIYKGRFEIKDLSPAVRDRIVSSVPFESLAPYITQYLR